jgi:CheY-like chemotaxis protein
VSKSARVVLVVDDEPDVLASVAVRLRGAGLEVLEALDATKAVALLEQGAPVWAILSDCNMPPMSGPDFAKLVRQRWPHIAFLAMSGRPRDPNLPEDVPFLAKPFRKAQLVAALEKAAAGSITLGRQDQRCP